MPRPAAARKADDSAAAASSAVVVARRRNPSRRGNDGNGGGRISYREPYTVDGDEDEEAGDAADGDDSDDMESSSSSAGPNPASSTDDDDEVSGDKSMETERDSPKKQRRSSSAGRVCGQATAAASGTDDEEDDGLVDSSDEDHPSRSDNNGRRRRKTRGGRAPRAGAVKAAVAKSSATSKNNAARRTSSRANKFTSSMAEPPASGRDWIEPDAAAPSESDGRTAARRTNDLRSGNRRAAAKSPVKRHATQRLSIRSGTLSSDDDYDAKSEDETVDGSEEEEEEEPLKIQKIVASRTETRARWREICRSVQTSEIENGSRWNQVEAAPETSGNDDDKIFEERFLIKWRDLSYLHCSWETQADIESQIERPAMYFSTFFRKSHNGLLYSADERCDGDYFDPGFVQIDRILEVHLPRDDQTYPEMTPESEDSMEPHQFGLVLDKADPNYDDGEGRQFLVKWANLGYSECSFEFERDLILNDVEYKPQLKSFLRRRQKPARSETRERDRKGDALRRRLYKAFGDKSKIGQELRDAEVAKFQQELLSKVHKNGGQLRDYQAEGVAWMIANFINGRGFILADEMGLGKTLQTARLVDYFITDLNSADPVLIIAPLSTLAHWKREFDTWTDLNVIAYYGSADDRRLIREHEFAYPVDRPTRGVAFNQLYLKKCLPKRKDDAASPWMVQVVITSPETVICDDYQELAAVPWGMVVIDEAHRLKNNNSKLTARLKAGSFSFRHKVLLTGTPIQNEIKELWTLMSFIDPDTFGDDEDTFMNKYGELDSKDKVDCLHDEIRPYILRRLKEDVETSVPPKEETIIEVELTAAQKQYYRALYEKNVGFLHKDKRSLDGPSLLNLAMQLRKCCNHLFLLNGVEDDIRASFKKSGEHPSEGDLLVRASGKLVLLDKLLPRLKEEGHRVLLFSQFKIMLDVLEDYLHARSMKYERIDGSITGNKRQQAIDRFQSVGGSGKELPFIMLLSTRAGGVGINLTAADTVIIFDSDFNPQNDLQAQARCHRIGQTKSVKVYRLLSSKSYEMRLFNISSMKLGLDQAVLKGFESGTGEGALSKSEIEKLLRHGAYEVFKEEREGKAEAESNEFVQQDIDTILARRSRTIVHENTGSQSNAAGSTFSKASFKVAKSPGDAGTSDADVDVDDPEFWKKVLGESKAKGESAAVTLDKASRRRYAPNYNEAKLLKEFESKITYNEDEDFASDSSDNSEVDDQVEDEGVERCRWGGRRSKYEWHREDVEKLVRILSRFGYGVLSWERLSQYLALPEPISIDETKRMSFSLCILALLETLDEEMSKLERSAEKRAEVSAEKGDAPRSDPDCAPSDPKQRKVCFDKICKANLSWLMHAIRDAVAYAKMNQPREKEAVERVLRPETWAPQPKDDLNIEARFAQAWQSLKNRGWKAETPTSGETAGKTRYEFDGKQYSSIESVLTAASKLHPDLASMCDTILEMKKTSRMESIESRNKERTDHLLMSAEALDELQLTAFVEKYAPLQLLYDRKRSKKSRLKIRRVMDTCNWMQKASSIVQSANATSGDSDAIKRLETLLAVDKRSALPHPSWTSRHDAILIHALVKHGWIECSDSFRDIAEDPAIRWGTPFELEPSAVPATPPQQQYDMVELRATACRAASFLNKHRLLVEEYKGFNLAAVTRAYGLTHKTLDVSASQASETSLTQDWSVDDSILDELPTEPGQNSRKVAEDLPTSKDLQRRARLLLTKCQMSATAAELASAPRNNHGFTVLDQSLRCNVLLAEMLRGLVKAKSNAKENKALCQAALDEAKHRVESIQEVMVRNPSVRDTWWKRLQDMERIATHIGLVHSHLNKSIRQFKNVLRAILGLEVDPGRSGKEELFPAERNTKHARTKLQFSTLKGGKPKIGDAKTGLAENPSGGDSTGEVAIETARKKLSDRKLSSVKNRGPTAARPPLELTEIEVLILYVSCTKGLPVWKEDWRSLLQTAESSDTRPRPYSMTWLEFGRSVARFAKSLFEAQKGKVAEIEDEFATRKKDGLSGYLHRRLSEAEKLRDSRERALDQAEDYACEPDTLAKKTIMMVAKLHQRAAHHSVASLKASAMVGPGVLDWFKADITRWASSLDLLEESGEPYALTAMDFIDDVSEQERLAIETSALMDNKGCWDVVNQTSLMSRLRSIFLNCERGYKRTLVENTVQALSARNQQWESQPTWWSSRGGESCYSTLHHDSLLLERLMHSGLDGVLENKKSYGVGADVTAANVSFHDAGLTKAAVQARATLLLRDLHAREATHTYHHHYHHHHHQQQQQQQQHHYSPRHRTTNGHAPEQRPRLSPGRGPVANGSPPRGGMGARRATDNVGGVAERSANASATCAQDDESDDEVQIVGPPLARGKRKSDEPASDDAASSPGKRVRSQ